MSKIQTDCRELIIGIGDGSIREISEEDCRKLSSWAVMFSMVLETVHPDLAYSTAADRHEFARTRTPSGDWMVWIGRTNCRLDPLPNHFAMKAFDMVEEEITSFGIQTTAWGMAGAYFIAFYGSPELDGSFEREIKSNLIIPRIWPPSPIVRMPELTLNEIDLDHLDREVLGIEVDQGFGRYSTPFF